MKKLFSILVTTALFLAITGIAMATTINVGPSMVPDENFPAINYGDAPTDFGPDSWQNTQTGGKVNWHARYSADGDYLSALFGSKAATLTIGDIDSISYWTKRPDGTTAGQDWAAFIYTRPTDPNYWYGYRFVNDYATHTDTDKWTQYSTANGMKFRENGRHSTGYLDFGTIKTNYGNELVEMISIQTMSNYTNFDGYMDGLTITLVDGSVGSVNFGAPVPEPATMLLFSLGLMGLAGVSRRKK